MDFQFLILLLAALACPIGMSAMMWWMHNSIHHSPVSKEKPLLRPSQEITDSLLERNQAQEARVAELERHLAVQQEVE